MMPYILALGLLLSYPKELDGHVEPSDRSWAAVLNRLRDTLCASLAALRRQDLWRGLITGAAFDAVFRTT